MLFLILAFAGVVAGQASSCTPVAGTCEYYRCLERHLQCERGPAFYSYPIRYGLKYCQIFGAMRFGPSSPPFQSATRWRDQTMVCLQSSLQRFLQRNPRPTCQVLTNFAFNSHPGCYTGGASICRLSPQNIYKIGTAVEGRDLVAGRSFIQGIGVVKKCAKTVPRDIIDATIGKDRRQQITDNKYVRTGINAAKQGAQYLQNAVNKGIEVASPAIEKGRSWFCAKTGWAC